MKIYLKKITITSALAVIASLAVPLITQLSGVSLIATAHAADSHEGGHGGSSHKGKGPQYKGGRGAEGHGGSDSAHKGSSNHGGGSKTLEDTVFHSEGGHTTGGDGGHKGGFSGKGGKKYMGGGKGGHEDDSHEDGGHEETDSGDTHDHTEPQ